MSGGCQFGKRVLGFGFVENDIVKVLGLSLLEGFRDLAFRELVNLDKVVELV